ncbi:hypothetical protein ACJ73_10018 [Blastomyces percursus]|uniref:Uncharacterized protein n=1 Tax=Blastomyces percursus TaxID=1658174 RepID=A0A1J9Q421_9EURO|nr:hypothetical protein ACJ73_10018 [Blastomyces percursus]
MIFLPFHWEWSESSTPIEIFVTIDEGNCREKPIKKLMIVKHGKTKEILDPVVEENTLHEQVEDTLARECL